MLVTDPRKLPEAFLELRTTGVERVTLRANLGPELPATLLGGQFSAEVPLVPGANRITATATSLDGEVHSTSVTIHVSSALEVAIDAPLDGTLYTEQLEQVEVTGTATLFPGADPSQLAGHPDLGIRKVLLRVGDSPPFATTLEAGRFRGRVMLGEGENRILATATAIDGRAADAVAKVTVRPPGCGELEVQALRGGEPALSISDRGVTLVVDASNSMWAQIDGRSRMEIAKEILGDALEWLPADLSLGLRVYGHQNPREQRDCRDTALMVPLGAESRAEIRDAIATFKPRGQTPLGFALEQVADDFGDFAGERAVVLVTDGVESCGGDPVAAARALQDQGPVPVHVIGFALAEDAGTSLRAIADASGGRFIEAANAEQLRAALLSTVGTPFRVTRAGSTVATGALGDESPISLAGGEYSVEIASQPPRNFGVELLPEHVATLSLDQRGAQV
ncbi:MAG: VWA domain-containing protein, partial [Myxococcota bacterium]